MPEDFFTETFCVGSTTTGDRGVKVGGIITVESTIHISNVMVADENGKASRLGVRKDDNGKNVRISRRTGKDI